MSEAADSPLRPHLMLGPQIGGGQGAGERQDCGSEGWGPGTRSQVSGRGGGWGPGLLGLREEGLGF